MQMTPTKHLYLRQAIVRLSLVGDGRLNPGKWPCEGPAEPDYRGRHSMGS
jgi:hypothetical protein